MIVCLLITFSGFPPLLFTYVRNSFLREFVKTLCFIFVTSIWIHGKTVSILYKTRRKILWFFIFMELEQFSYYFVTTKTPNMSHVKYKWVYLNPYQPKQISKALWDNNIHNLKYGWKILRFFFIFMETEKFSYYYVTPPRHWIWVTRN